MNVFIRGLSSLILTSIGIICVLFSVHDTALYYAGIAVIALASYLGATALFHNCDYKILLDDERVPVKRGWTVVRNSTAFISLMVIKRDKITAVSFDYSLGHDSLSGMECLQWLITTMIKFPEWFPKLSTIIVHSGSGVGGEDMVKYAREARNKNPSLANLKVMWYDTTISKSHVKMPKAFNYMSRR